MHNEKEQLKADEGFRSKVYRCSEGVQTIGYGRNLESKGVTQQEAEQMLDNDIRDADNECRRRIPCYPYLDDDRQGVVLNMLFNLGWPRLQRFTRFLKALEQRDYAKAADEMLDSLWHEQVGARAERLAARMRGRA